MTEIKAALIDVNPMHSQRGGRRASFKLHRKIARSLENEKKKKCNASAIIHQFCLIGT